MIQWRRLSEWLTEFTQFSLTGWRGALDDLVSRLMIQAWIVDEAFVLMLKNPDHAGVG
jgi:hypothetical protein